MIKKDSIYWRGIFSLEITGKCNLNCPHCLNNGSQDYEISTETIDRLLDFSDKFEQLHFTGGEPTLALNKMEYFLEESKKRNIKIYSLNMTTNGTGFNVEFYNVLDRYKSYIKQCLEEYFKKSISDECATAHIGISISDDEYHEIDAVEAYKKAIKLNFHKVAFITFATRGNIVAQVGRGKDFGVVDYRKFKTGKIGVSHRNTYCPYSKYLCKIEKDPAVMCIMGLDYNGDLCANGANGLPKNECVICNIMNTESILDSIDVWNNKNPLYCLETPGTMVEDINIDKEINMLCNKIRHEKNYELLGAEDTVSNLLFYEMYGNTEEEIESKLLEFEPEEDTEVFLWNQKYGKYSDIHLLYPELKYEECEELAELSSKKIQNRKRILSLKYKNFMREVEREIQLRNKNVKKRILYHNALKKKYDSGFDSEMLCQIWNEKFNENIDIQEFVDSMQCYEEFTEATKVNGLCYWFKCRINEFKNDNVTEEKSFLFEDILLHYLVYCTFVENNLSDKMDDDTVKGIVDVARKYKSFFKDLLSVDVLLFSIQNSKDQRLVREATFSDEELKDAMERLNNDLLLRLKYIKLCYILQNLNK